LRKSVANEFGIWRDVAQAALHNRSMTWLEQQLQEKDSEIKEAVERLAELENQCDAICRSADEASASWLCCEAKLGENIKKMSVELCSKQAEIEHLRSEVKAALNEKESIKHDLTVIQAHYQTELSEHHRSKLGGKTPRTPRGLTPRDTTQTAPVGSPGAHTLTPGASTTENPGSAERRGKGKYYMC
jgi:chromosome segregation ATPase